MCVCASKLYYIILHHITSHYITLHHITSHYITYIRLHTLDYIIFHYIPLCTYAHMYIITYVHTYVYLHAYIAIAIYVWVPCWDGTCLMYTTGSSNSQSTIWEFWVGNWQVTHHSIWRVSTNQPCNMSGDLCVINLRFLCPIWQTIKTEPSTAEAAA